jgi:hypothetical protein
MREVICLHGVVKHMHNFIFNLYIMGHLMSCFPLKSVRWRCLSVSSMFSHMMAPRVGTTVQEGASPCSNFGK